MACGWAMTILYFLSRVPQTYRILTEGSLVQLSFGIFLLTLLGNVTYTMSITVRSQDRAFIRHHLPWLVDSVKTAMQDFCILMLVVLARCQRSKPHLLSQSFRERRASKFRSALTAFMLQEQQDQHNNTDSERQSLLERKETRTPRETERKERMERKGSDATDTLTDTSEAGSGLMPLSLFSINVGCCCLVVLVCSVAAMMLLMLMLRII